MATWSGWIQQFLSAANFPNTDGNRTWLSEWAQNANTNCRNNPIDLSRKQGGSSACSKLTDSRTAQNYTSHAQAAAAFINQINSGNFPNLLAGMKAGDPFARATLPAVLGDLLTWGSSQWEKHLENEFGVTPGGGGIGGGGNFTPTATNVYKSWGDIQTSINRNLPTALHRITVSQTALLRTLAHKRRVRS